MSSPLRIQVIAEGDTDKIVLDAFMEAILGHKDFVSTLIQPDTSLAFGHAGEHGGGWRGVMGKCREIRGNGGFDEGGYLANTDILIIHLDGEVAAEPDVACAEPCPPPGATADALRTRIWGWLGGPPSPHVVVAIPMKETEAWAFVALRPQDRLAVICNDQIPGEGTPCLECRDKPSHLLAGGAPRLVVSGKKKPTKYRAVERALVEGWVHVRRLSQARRFEHDFQGALDVLTVAEIMTS